jgi:plastocyanin
MQHKQHRKDSMKKAFLLVASTFLLAGCLPQATPAPSPTPAVQKEETVEQETTNSGVNAEDATVVEVEAENFSFSMKEIRVEKGEKLIVKFTNKEGFHDFLIDELKVNSGMVAQANTIELEIPTDTVGTYEYYCSVGQHRANGMFGKLIIEE